MKPGLLLAGILVLAACGDGATTSPLQSLDAATTHDAPAMARDAVADGPVVPPDAGATRDAGAVADAGDAGDGAAPLGPLVAYVSGYAPDITAYLVNPGTGALTSKGTTTAFGSSPSFLAISRDGAHLYAVDEATTGRVGAYSVNPTTFALTFLNAVSSGGNGPAFVAVDATGKNVLVANYGDGTVSVLSAGADGRLGNATVTSAAVGANAHMVAIDPSNKLAFVPCKGADYVAQFHFDATAGTLTPSTPPHLATAAGAGPRHLAFHPTLAFAYLINETNSTMTACTLDAAAGTLTAIQTVSTLPQGFSGTNTAAEIWVHPSGAFVFGSNRGDDSIVTFSIDAATGKLSLVGHTKSGGTMPRDFTLDPTGTFLYAANQGSNDVVPFRVGNLGALATTATPVTVASPSFVGLVRFPAP